MVSAAKLKRAQDRVVAARPFTNKMVEVLGELAKRTDEDFHHPLLDLRADERYVLVLITADKGLCGAFNTNLVKAAQAFIESIQGKNIEIFAVGRKGRDFFRSRHASLAGEFIGLTGKGRVELAESFEVAEIDHRSSMWKTKASTKCFCFTTNSSRFFTTSCTRAATTCFAGYRRRTRRKDSTSRFVS